MQTSWLMLRLITFVLLSTASVFSQSKNRVVQWPEIIINPVNTTGSGYSPELAKFEALEITEIAVRGNSITVGEFFAADDEWLKNLTVRVKNISSLNISSIQMNLFLPEIMPGGPLVTLCYGCGSVGNGQSIMPGAEVEMKLVFYSWLADQIKAKSSLSLITRAEIQNIIVKLPDGRKWITACLRTANPKNACPTPAP
jgi:hypothetical protein